MGNIFVNIFLIDFSTLNKLSPSAPMVLPGQSHWGGKGEEDAAGNFYKPVFIYAMRVIENGLFCLKLRDRFLYNL